MAQNKSDDGAIEKALQDFIVYMRYSTETEIYNEAGLQHEMAFFLRNTIGDKYKIELERNISVCVHNPKSFCKKEMDIYLIDRIDPTLKYCIELKTTHGRAVPRRMFQTFEDVMFLEQLKAAGFTKCFLFFTSPNKDYWQKKMADQNIRRYFHGTEVNFQCLYEDDVADFLKKDAVNKCVMSIKGSYTALWNDLKVQGSSSWRYFLLAL